MLPFCWESRGLRRSFVRKSMEESYSVNQLVHLLLAEELQVLVLQTELFVVMSSASAQ